jgi:hypothetical protein
MATNKPILLRNLEHGFPETFDLNFSDDGVLTPQGLRRLIEHFKRLGEHGFWIHPSWYQGELPTDAGILRTFIWDGMLHMILDAGILVDRPMLPKAAVYPVFKHQAFSFENGSILSNCEAAKISKDWVNPNCIFSLIEKGIIPYFGDGFLAIRQPNKQLTSMVFSYRSFR